MDIRKMALALALPAAFGVACQTSQSSRTASREEPAPAPAGTAATGTAATPGAPGSEPGASETGTSGDSTGTLTGERSATGTAGSGTMGESSDLKGHSSDQVLMGTVASVSSGSLLIESHMGGDARTLQVVPETIITVDGREGRISDIKEGQPIRASFNEQDGKQVAVKIEAGPMMGGGHMGGHMGSDMGTTGSGTATTPGAPGSQPGASETGTSGESTGTSGTGTGAGQDTSGERR